MINSQFHSMQDGLAMTAFVNLLEKYPYFMTVNNLIELGMYKSREHAYFLRKRGYTPDYIYINPKKIVYTKDAVLEFMKDKLVTPSQQTWRGSQIMDGKSCRSKKPIELKVEEAMFLRKNGLFNTREQINEHWEFNAYDSAMKEGWHD